MKRKLAENWKRIEQRVEDACAKSGRSPDSVKIVAVTKKASLDVIRALVDLGIRDLGENRVQDLTRKAGMVHEWLTRRVRPGAPGQQLRPRWHMIGHLQRNKVKAALPWSDLVQSVDSLRLAEEIDARSKALGRKTVILMEVNPLDEPQKNGIAVAATTHLVEQVHPLANIELRGLMAMAPLTDDEGRIRSAFCRVRELFDEIRDAHIAGPEFTELSMGMSNDLEVGIDAGATMVRVGTALYEGIELAPEAVHAD
jgi:hypothetical protein